MFKRLIYIVLILSTALQTLTAQPVERFIKVVVTADRPDWTYKIGDKVTFTISVSKNGNLLNNKLLNFF